MILPCDSVAWCVNLTFVVSDLCVFLLPPFSFSSLLPPPLLPPSLLSHTKSTELDNIDESKREAIKAEALAACVSSGGDVWDACRRGDMDLVRSFFIHHGTAMLLEGKKSRCHHKEEWGRTLVHTAAWWGHTSILRFLLTLGADVNVHDTSVTRTTPLLEAARAGNRHICEFLIRYGAKVKLSDSQGDNPFHWAARRGHGTLITAMLRRSEEFQGSSSTRGTLKAASKTDIEDLPSSFFFFFFRAPLFLTLFFLF